MRQRNTLSGGEKYRVGKWLETNHARLGDMTPEEIYDAIYAEHQIRIPDKVNRATWLRKMMGDIGLPDVEFKRLIKSARMKRAEEWALFKRIVSSTLLAYGKDWDMLKNLPGHDAAMLMQWATESVNGDRVAPTEEEETDDLE